MKDVGIVRGGAAMAVPIYVGKDRVDVHSEIQDLGDGMYSYREVQYSKDEYIKVLAEKDTEKELQVTDLQLALVELYERVALNG